MLIFFTNAFKIYKGGSLTYVAPSLGYLYCRAVTLSRVC